MDLEIEDLSLYDDSRELDMYDFFSAILLNFECNKLYYIINYKKIIIKKQKRINYILKTKILTFYRSIIMFKV